MLPGPAEPGCCLVSFHFLWGKLSTRTVVVSEQTQCTNILIREAFVVPQQLFKGGFSEESFVDGNFFVKVIINVFVYRSNMVFYSGMNYGKKGSNFAARSFQPLKGVVQALKL